MKPETQIFLDALALLEDHAVVLEQAATRLEDPTARSASVDIVPDAEAHDPLAALLREAAVSCRRWARHVEESLADAKALHAFASIASAMHQVDRLFWERRPDVDLQEHGVAQSLHQRFGPIYDRAVLIFEIDPDSTDDRRFEDYSRWLAANPNPWSETGDTGRT